MAKQQTHISIYQKIQLELNSLLGRLSQMFQKDELAYLTIQGKNELQIRDRVAWNLQLCLDSQYPQQYIVRREWSSSGRSKVDVAILKLNASKNNYDEVVALIEFKAHSFLNQEQWVYGEFLKDIIKMKNETSKAPRATNADIYFIFLHTCQDASCYPVFSNAVAYENILINKNTILLNKNSQNTCVNIMKNYWNLFFQNPFQLLQGVGLSKYKSLMNKQMRLPKKMPTPTPSFQNVGSYFNYSIYVSPMVWGPFKSADIAIV